MTNRHHSRRTILAAAGAAAALLSVAACSSSITTSQIATDANLIAQGLQPLAADVAAIPGVPSATLAKVQADLAKLQQAAAGIATATAGQQTTSVQGIAALVEEIASVVLPLVPGGAPWVLVVQAAQALVPVILAAAGVSGSTGAAPTMPATQARLILAASH